MYQSLSEKFVHEFCIDSFLSLWTFPNPLNAKGKELCDVLIVCDPYIIVISVKDVSFTGSEESLEAHIRWQKKAIDASAKQLYGAVRALEQLTNVKSVDSKLIQLPIVTTRQVHRVAVALGGGGKSFLKFGDFGKGFVHVFDEKTFTIALSEFDTITDFVNYLSAKEKYILNGGNFMFEGGEEDLIAHYVSYGGRIAVEGALFVVGDDLWTGFSSSGEWQTIKNENKISYAWDRLIESVVDDYRNERLLRIHNPSDTETVLRCMAKENRIERRMLSKLFLGFYKDLQVRSRMIPSSSGILYLFLKVPADTDREERRAELMGRSIVARGITPTHHTVVGIATEIQDPGGYSLDISYFHVSEWEEEDARIVERIQNEFGFFVEPEFRKISEMKFGL